MHDQVLKFGRDRSLGRSFRARPLALRSAAKRLPGLGRPRAGGAAPRLDRPRANLAARRLPGRSSEPGSPLQSRRGRAVCPSPQGAGE